MLSYSQEEFYNDEIDADVLHSHTPSIIDEPITPAPQFCKRISIEEVEASAKLNTHKELLKMGELIGINKNKSVLETASTDIFNIKTMSLQELDEYVENKLSKDHYSPEVIYLLFKIQTLLLEKQHMNRQIADNNINIRKLQKELLDEKTLTMDLKESMKESVYEIEANEKEYKRESALVDEKYKVITAKYDTTLLRKNQYETVLFYICPVTLLCILLFINNIILIIYKYI